MSSGVAREYYGSPSYEGRVAANNGPSNTCRKVLHRSQINVLRYSTEWNFDMVHLVPLPS